MLPAVIGICIILVGCATGVTQTPSPSSPSISPPATPTVSPRPTASPSPSSSPSPRAGICAQAEAAEIGLPPEVRQYLAAWNERDAEARLRRLDQIWTEGATYIESPGVADAPVVGRAAMSELIARNQGAPGEWFELRAWYGGYAHHDLLVMPWRHCTPDGPSGTIGTDYAELDPSGRIVMAVSFAPLTPDDSGMGDQPPRVCAGFDTLDLSAVPPIAERYTAAWNAQTSAERKAILNALAEEDTQFGASWDPSTRTGPAEITAFIDQWKRPGSYIEFSAWGDADHHDGWFHIRWRDCAPGDDIMAGIEILHAGSDGKLERAASFGGW